MKASPWRASAINGLTATEGVSRRPRQFRSGSVQWQCISASCRAGFASSRTSRIRRSKRSRSSRLRSRTICRSVSLTVQVFADVVRVPVADARVISCGSRTKSRITESSARDATSGSVWSSRKTNVRLQARAPLRWARLRHPVGTDVFSIAQEHENSTLDTHRRLFERPQLLGRVECAFETRSILSF